MSRPLAVTRLSSVRDSSSAAPTSTQFPSSAIATPRLIRSLRQHTSSALQREYAPVSTQRRDGRRDGALQESLGLGLLVLGRDDAAGGRDRRREPAHMPVTNFRQ